MILYYIISYHIISYHTILFYITSCYILLYYIILYCMKSPPYLQVCHICLNKHCSEMSSDQQFVLRTDAVLVLDEVGGHKLDEDERENIQYQCQKHKRPCNLETPGLGSYV